MPRVIFSRDIDLYARLGDLGVQLAKVKSQLEELVTQEQEIKTRIAEVASALSKAKNESQTTVFREQESDSETLPTKRKELLVLLHKNPDGDYARFATEMYGDDERNNRINVAGLFSHLRADGYVVPAGRGRHKLTEKGREMIEETA